MRNILFFLLLIPITSLAQIEDCRIVYLDSNHRKHTINEVTLHFFASDTLTFFESNNVEKIHLKHLKSLSFRGRI